jgi:poly(beta-D-mannuronate) lyase
MAAAFVYDAEMTIRGLLVASVALALPAGAQHVRDPHASVVDVAARQAMLRTSADPRWRSAIRNLRPCVAMRFVPAPVGRMIIPNHYLSGSNGPTNPAEEAVTRVYTEFESRITAGMNQYLATGSHSESGCALAQLDAWAQAHALLDYDRQESPQAWYQVEWTLSAAGITDSVLVKDETLDPVAQKRVTAWLQTACHRDISFENSTDSNNNHHYWRALAATAIGVTAGDDTLFRFGIHAYQEAIGEIDARGAFPKEMARHENAIIYQGFALEPLVVIAQFAARQGINLYAYQAHGRTLRDAIVFFGRAVDDPKLVEPYTTDAQVTGFHSGDFAALAFYTMRFGTTGLPPSIVTALKGLTTSTRIGGSTTILAAK